MTMGVKNENSLLYKAVEYQVEAVGYMEMVIKKSYLKFNMTHEECMSNYHYFNGRYLGLIEALAAELKIPEKRVEYLVKVLKRKL